MWSMNIKHAVPGVKALGSFAIEQVAKGHVKWPVLVLLVSVAIHRASESRLQQDQWGPLQLAGTPLTLAGGTLATLGEDVSPTPIQVSPPWLSISRSSDAGPYQLQC